MPALVGAPINSKHLKDFSFDNNFDLLEDIFNNHHGNLLPSVSKHGSARTVFQQSNSRVAKIPMRREGYQISDNINLSPTNQNLALRDSFFENEGAIPSIAQSYKTMSAKSISWLADEESDEIRCRPVLKTSKSVDTKARGNRAYE